MARVIKHPLIDIKLTVMRDAKTDHVIFRKNLNEIASLMVYEILRDYQPRKTQVKTPIDELADGFTFAQEIVVVPILRAGLGMTDGILSLVPQAKTGHIGIYRDEKTFVAHEYFYKMPTVSKDSQIIIVDPMLASGVSANDAINLLKKDGFLNIKFVALIAAPEGILTVEKNNPDVEIFVVSIDKQLNDKKYIVPGLGDAGDRIFGTK